MMRWVTANLRFVPGSAKAFTLPAIQAVLRSMVAVAAKGNGPVQRFLIEVIQAIERENAMPTHEGDMGGVAERLAAALKRVGEETDGRAGSDRHVAPRMPRRRGRRVRHAR
jgi:hypothetical protein